MLNNSGEEISNLKLGPLNSQSNSNDDDQFATGYIALVLREARRWFLVNSDGIYKNVKIIWALNIGLPSRSYDNSELCLKFRSLAIAGWALSNKHEPLSIDHINESLNIARKQLDQPDQLSLPEGFLHKDDINVVPEIIAEVVGYSKSDLRISGLHMVLDIGASTTDLSGFIIHNPEIDDEYAILTAEVESCGVINFDNAKNSGNNAFASFQEEFYKFIGNTNKELKDNRCPNDWKRGFPLFLCGGGAKIKFYIDTVKTINERLKTQTQFSGFDLRHIPKPSDLATPNIPINSYHRLAVAYGLGYREMDIGNIVPRRIISDLHPPPSPPKTKAQYYQEKEDHYLGT